MEYFISSRDYLARARDCLAEGDSRGFFYAAFELRCGIEARMSQYLEVWEHISERKKKGWRIANLARNIEESFKLGEKYIRLAIHNKDSSELIICYYYAPVSSNLKKAGEKMGNYLHAMRKLEKVESPFWPEFAKELREIANLLQIANTGTLLGPPLMEPETDRMIMNTEVIPGFDSKDWMNRMPGKKCIIQVQYLDSLPNHLEQEAHIWDFSRIDG